MGERRKEPCALKWAWKHVPTLNVWWRKPRQPWLRWPETTWEGGLRASLKGTFRPWHRFYWKCKRNSLKGLMQESDVAGRENLQ